MLSSLNSQLKLLCDEDVPKKVVDSLLKEGFDVKRVPFGASDKKVAELAKLEGRVLITFDRHFTNPFLFPPEEYSGIIFIRIRPPLIKTVLSALLNLFRSLKPSEFKGKLFTLRPIWFKLYPKKFPFSR